MHQKMQMVFTYTLCALISILALNVDSSFAIEEKLSSPNLTDEEIKNRILRHRGEFDKNYIKPDIDKNDPVQVGKLTKMTLQTKFIIYYANIYSRRHNLKSCAEMLKHIPTIVSGAYTFHKDNGDAIQLNCAMHPHSVGIFDQESNDTYPPHIGVLKRPAKQIFAPISNASFDFAVQDVVHNGIVVPSSKLKSVECRMNNDSWEPCSGTKSYDSLATGNYNFQIRSVDGNNNISVSENKFDIYQCMSPENYPSNKVINVPENTKYLTILLPYYTLNWQTDDDGGTNHYSCGHGGGFLFIEFGKTTLGSGEVLQAGGQLTFHRKDEYPFSTLRWKYNGKTVAKEKILGGYSYNGWDRNDHCGKPWWTFNKHKGKIYGNCSGVTFPTGTKARGIPSLWKLNY